MDTRRTTSSFRAGRNTALALLALLSLISFDASHVVHHLTDDEAPTAQTAGTHAWWDGILFHTGTLVEPSFVVPIPAHRFVTYALVDLSGRPHADPPRVREPRAPPIV